MLGVFGWFVDLLTCGMFICALGLFWGFIDSLLVSLLFGLMFMLCLVISVGVAWIWDNVICFVVVVCVGLIVVWVNLGCVRLGVRINCGLLVV